MMNVVRSFKLRVYMVIILKINTFMDSQCVLCVFLIRNNREKAEETHKKKMKAMS